MDRRTRSGWLAVATVTAGLALSPGRAYAQFGLMGGPPAPPGGGAGVATGGGSPYGGSVWSGMAANPFMNPYANPYLNPLATQTGQTMAPGNAALYFIAAQQMNGGIGSGRLGGPRAAAPATRPGTTGTAADQARGGGANSPGAGAARFFNRDYPTSLGSNRYYSRQNAHFPRPGK